MGVLIDNYRKTHIGFSPAWVVELCPAGKNNSAWAFCWARWVVPVEFKALRPTMAASLSPESMRADGRQRLAGRVLATLMLVVDARDISYRREPEEMLRQLRARPRLGEFPH